VEFKRLMGAAVGTMVLLPTAFTTVYIWLDVCKHEHREVSGCPADGLH